MPETTPRRSLRLWPGVVAVVLLWLAWVVLPRVVPGTILVSFGGAGAGAVAVLLWWLFFSRAPWVDRVGAIVLMVAAMFVTSRLVDESVATAGQGMLLFIYAVPALSLALVSGAVVGSRVPGKYRRATTAVAILLGAGVFTLLRTGGITGGAKSDFHWRWTPTPEERLLARADEKSVVVARSGSAPLAAPVSPPTLEKQLTAQSGDEGTLHASPPATAATTNKPSPGVTESAFDPAGTTTTAEWAGFRGSHRDGIVHGPRIATDWSKSPPVALWRRSIGPGWSSFAVLGNVLYTQEQRGDDEVVSSYNLTTGAPVWRHGDPVRFWESNAGAGPRATPTLNNGRVYTFGATGILNALDARDGSVIWSRNAAKDAGTEVPGWGFAGSPLVIGDVVIVAAAGRLAAFDLATGHPRWVGPEGGMGYSSPQLVTISGVPQILLLNRGGATSVSPADGKLLWEYQSPTGSGNIVQPAVTAEGDILIAAIDSSAMGVGTRRIAVTHGPAGWSAEERWTSTGLKPSFNDFVVNKGHAFGFDGSILACIDLADGSRKWKGGRYGNGQLVLLQDQDVLLVVTEEGELALVSATSDKFTELARFPALEGKTWNHPVLVGDVLVVRNGEEMAAFRLALASH